MVISSLLMCVMVLPMQIRIVDDNEQEMCEDAHEGSCGCVIISWADKANMIHWRTVRNCGLAEGMLVSNYFSSDPAEKESILDRIIMHSWEIVISAPLGVVRQNYA